ncbi:spore germination protein GerPE [Thalassobacillus hwangdonensis]|uniref:Spore germination protein GerPE n=1 Tax=Thalassobacillus hwangdonensis TaxID=546108 RepID=A0ABW3KXI5_9BACI
MNWIKVTSVTTGSTFAIGDTAQADPYSRVLAVQKEGADFTEDEFKFEDYPIFTRQLKREIVALPKSDCHIHHNPYIQVDTIRVFGVSTASVMQVGSLGSIDAESRTKHIRFLRDERNGADDIH